MEYFRWPLVIALIWVAAILQYLLIDYRVSLVLLGYLLVYLALAIGYYLLRRKRLLTDLVQFAVDYDDLQKKVMTELEVPFGMVDQFGHLLWANDDFLEIIQDEGAARRNIQNVLPNVPLKKLESAEFDIEYHAQIEDQVYRVVLRKVALDKEQGELEEEKTNSPSRELVQIFLHDETELLRYKKENEEERLIIGLLYIDNYEEVVESIDETRRALLVARIDQRINKYMQQYDGIVKKLEKDKYVVLFKARYLEEMKANKFSILEEVRGIKTGNNISATLSIGIGLNKRTYNESYESARAAIDLALGRGGDQVVLRDGQKISYYGGKNVSVERNTRVKARVKAHALRELIEAKERVVVMGHALADVDSVGAAIGIYRIAKTLGKRAYIVVNDVSRSVRPMLQDFQNNPEYEEDMFVQNARARELVNVNTLLVVVDVGRINYTECPQLLNQTNTIVVLDHHRSTEEAIQNAVLSYIEPYASSACEMVAEILQYTGEGIKLKPVEADALYSGIIIDTDHFLTKTGVRTFEAAAYLRRNGADMSKIRKAFRSDMKEYRFRAEAISKTEIYLGHYAIGECLGSDVESPTIQGAQVANELLNITGIRASFVLTPFNDKIYISARSIDEVNVQLVMEKLGGGGNPSVAGAQLPDCTIEEAKERLIRVLETMQEEGEI